MAYVSVDCGDNEWIHDNKPKLNENIGCYEDAIYESFDGQGGRKKFHHYSDIELPKGTIEKILGRKLTYEEGPVKI